MYNDLLLINIFNSCWIDSKNIYLAGENTPQTWEVRRLTYLKEISCLLHRWSWVTQKQVIKFILMWPCSGHRRSMLSHCIFNLKIWYLDVFFEIGQTQIQIQKYWPHKFIKETFRQKLLGFMNRKDCYIKKQ